MVEKVELEMETSYTQIKATGFKISKPDYSLLKAQHTPGLVYAQLKTPHLNWSTAMFLVSGDINPWINSLIMYWPRVCNKSGLLGIFKKSLKQRGANECWFNLLRQSNDNSIPLLGILQENMDWFQSLDLKLQSLTCFLFLREKPEFSVGIMRENVKIAGCIGREVLFALQEAGIKMEVPELGETDIDFYRVRVSLQTETRLRFLLNEPANKMHMTWFLRDVKNHADSVRFVMNNFNATNQSTRVVVQLLRSDAARRAIIFDWTIYTSRDPLKYLNHFALVLSTSAGQQILESMKHPNFAIAARALVDARHISESLLQRIFDSDFDLKNIKNCLIRYCSIQNRSELELLLIRNINTQMLFHISQIYVSDKEKIYRKHLDTLCENMHKANVGFDRLVVQMAIQGGKSDQKWARFVLKLIAVDVKILLLDILDSLQTTALDDFYAVVPVYFRVFKEHCVGNVQILALIFFMSDPQSVRLF